jgi:ribosomal protein L11 methylase PrmA
MLSNLHPQSILDMGANTGEFSRIARQHAPMVLAPDMDALAAERHYTTLIANNIDGILPLVIDLSNPSPSLGWHSRERLSFISRCKFHTVLALALIHHLCIGNNAPLGMCAELFASMGKNLILEFVPKQDSQVQRLLATREDIFPDYTLDCAIKAFSDYFTCVEIHPVPDSSRTLLLLTLVEG